MHILGKNKIYNFQLHKNVTLARGMDQSPVQLQKDVVIVEVTEGYDQIKDFSLFNKLVLNVQVMGRKLQIRVLIVMDRALIKLQRKFP